MRRRVPGHLDEGDTASVQGGYSSAAKTDPQTGTGSLCVLTGEGQEGREEGDPNPGWEERVKEK